jgi:ABC-type multidrug transport system fused ATPase/permease subunit
VKLFRGLLRSHLRRVAGVLALTATAAFGEAAGLALFSVFLNLLLGARGALAQPEFLRLLQDHVRANPGLFFLLLGLIYVGKSGLSLAATYASISFALKVADEWRLRLFEALLRIPARSLPPKQGVLLQLVIDEPGVAGAGLSAAGILVQNLASALTIYVTLLWISPVITLGLTAIGAIAVAALAVLARLSRKAAERRSRTYSDGYGYLTEMLGALKQVRIFGLEKAVRDRAEAHVTRMRAANQMGSAISSSPRMVIELVFVGAAILILAIMAPRLGETAILSGAALAAAAAMRLLPSFSAAAGTWVQVHQSLPAMRRIQHELERLERSAAADPEKDHHAPSTLRQAIECRGVRFSYPERPPVLRDVDLRIDAGRFVAIVGASGSGKSTLVDLLCGLYDPDQGEILVDGKDLRTLSKPGWRGLLGVVPQDAFLLSGTLRENVCLLRPDCPDDVLHEALAVVGADKLVADLPAGLDTVVGERGVALSGGQRQRLAMARVLVREPQILMLDEATSALDQESDEAVFSAIERYRGRLTLVVIAHRLASVRRADVIHVMQEGTVVESGDHDGLLRRGGVYANLWRSAQRDGDQARGAPAGPGSQEALDAYASPP